ncbi:LLM class flavin-dependent oxidoreductase [Hymenobacter cellulosivorans]|uniref:LLM class flavin-dependent oxidoreductase n=1 Tax=Hymenobacter cellulosivorans TaxID=2932249 RepID=A0ABY4F6T0_9BACT|nr:LLM class flavin-dependent oxidoreductase [Hymenobacter cellulosivorans]UOQ52373.1 LLM class flavin-dependent oxidoreductase [Hymenobacter cellulosivorans]
MKSKIKIGLLEFGIRSNKSNNPIQSIYEVIDYAVAADNLGFSRFWLTENYIKNRKDMAWSTPEMLLPIILGMTDNINVGIAGLIINTHNPFRIAHNYKLLSNIYTGRVDIGIVKGSLEDSILNRFDIDLKSNRSSFKGKINQLLDYLRCEDDLLSEGIVVPPFLGGIPDVWYLGSSYQNFNYIIENKLNFGRTIFHENANKDHKLKEFKFFQSQYFSANGVKPKTVLTFSGYCHSSRRKISLNESESKIPIDAINIIGPPDLFYEKLLEYQEFYGYDEFIFNNVSVNQKQSLATLENIAKYM